MSKRQHSTLLFLAFTPRPGTTTTQSTNSASVQQPPSLRTAITVVTLCILHFLLTFLISIIFLARYPSHLGTWANTLGLLCTILASIQYLPQIYTTYRLKHIGSLSIGTMVIQTPGAFILATSLAVRLGKEGWSAWLVYVVTGVLQGCLLVMAVVFERRERRRKREEGVDGVWTETDLRGDGDEVGGNGRVDDENTPLLQERQRQTQTQTQIPQLGLDGQPSSPLASATYAEVYNEPSTNSTPSPSAPVNVQQRRNSGQDEQEEQAATDGNIAGRRDSKWRWQKGDFSYKVW